MIVMGAMIGSGIFITSAESARLVGSPGWLLVAWALAGLMTITGALCSRRARGDDAPGRRAVCLPPRGVRPAVRLPVRLVDVPGRPDGTIAAVAVAFAKFLGRLLPGDRRRRLPRRADPSLGGYAISLSTQQLVAVALIVGPDGRPTRAG